MDSDKVITLKATDGSTVEFVDSVIASGNREDVCDVYFSPDRTYGVRFYRNPLNADTKDRLARFTGQYRESIFNQVDGDYRQNLFCWPTRLVEWEGRTGIVCPAYQSHFFFKDGRFKGEVKEGKWFASAKLRNKFLTPEEKGDWLAYMRMCIQIARAVRHLHAAGFAHADLSYKKVLVDPETGKAAVILDIDDLVVPGKYQPDVVETPDFVAPEVLETRDLPAGDPNKKLPSITTNRHSLAVLIYMYLLYRHPLRGGKVHDVEDPAKDEELSMGSKALFIEHPKDASNRPKINQLTPSELPQADVGKLPYTLCGPHLKALFDRAFIEGLHCPEKRPSAADWESALIRTTDLMQPCQNPACEAHWFVFDNTTKPRCPFCGTEYRGQLPVLNLYSSPTPGTFRPENYRLMVYDKQSLYMWHVNRFVIPNERVADEDRKPVGDFHFHQGRWILVNRRLNSLYDKDVDRKIEIGGYVELTEGKKILLSTENGGRLIVVQLVSN